MSRPATKFRRQGWPEMTTTQIAAVPRQRLLPPTTGRAGFADALRSEFTKIRSTRSTNWTLLALVVVTVGIGALASTSEYSTGMIRTSLAVQPRRGVLFTAKAMVFAVVSLVTGLVACFASFFIGQAILSSHHLNVTLSQPGVLRAVIGGALFLTACGMLAYGLGAILRHTAGAITAAIGLLFVLSILVNFLPQSWQHNVDKWMPAIAGAQIWTTKNQPGSHLFTAWPGFAVLATYAAVALMAGLVLFRTRDA